MSAGVDSLVLTLPVDGSLLFSGGLESHASGTPSDVDWKSTAAARFFLWSGSFRAALGRDTSSAGMRTAARNVEPATGASVLDAAAFDPGAGVRQGCFFLMQFQPRAF
eukprot:4873667-Amphidinium_carterae.1